MTATYTKQLLDTAGDGSGTTNPAGSDYSVTPGRFYIQPDQGKMFKVHWLQLYIETNAALASYGSGSALPNGWKLRRLDKDHGVTEEIIKGVITRNVDFVSGWEVAPLFSNTGGTLNYIQALWVPQEPLILYGHRGDRIEARYTDDFTAAPFVKHRLLVSGILEDDRIFGASGSGQVSVPDVP